MLIRLASIVFLACATTIVADASPVTFTLHNGTFASGATITGTTVIDTATGMFVSADLVYSLGGSSVTFNGAFGSTVVLFGGPYGLLYNVSLAEVVEVPGGLNVPDIFEPLIPALLVGYQ